MSFAIHAKRVLHLNAKISRQTPVRYRRYELKYQGNPGRRLGCVELVHISMHIVATPVVDWCKFSPRSWHAAVSYTRLEPSWAENLRWNKVANPGSRPRARPKRDQRRCIRITDAHPFRPSKACSFRWHAIFGHHRGCWPLSPRITFAKIVAILALPLPLSTLRPVSYVGVGKLYSQEALPSIPNASSVRRFFFSFV